MRIGVYVDGYNLYYGGRSHFGASSAGWKWLDIRALATSKLPHSWIDQGAAISRVVYCTARAKGKIDPELPRRQDAFLQALQQSGSVDVIEYGNFVVRTKTSLLADLDAKSRPVLVQSRWPIQVKDSGFQDVSNAHFLARHMHTEEKGSDVNVATHLLLDVLGGEVDAAIVVSNDSDLKMPIAECRHRVPVGVLNPNTRPMAGGLKGDPNEGVGSHWWGRLDAADFLGNQLPNPVGSVKKPESW